VVGLYVRVQVVWDGGLGEWSQCLFVCLRVEFLLKTSGGYPLLE